MELGNYKENRNIIEDIVLDSIAEEMGIEPGDVLLSINDMEIKDVIDYKYLMADDFLVVEIEKPEGEIWELEIEKDYNEDLGIIFTNPLIDRAKSCKNKCMFCFIDQLPPNMRDTLYFKDDDSRLSFLQGNFITLTNMSEDEIDRIIRYRLSPVNVSVHTTNPELRVKMLKNKNAGKVYEILKRFHEAKLEVNCQIVLIPGINDGKELDRTINDLSKLYPTIESVAVVPVGVTKYRDHLEKLQIFNKDMSLKLLEELDKMQKTFLDKINTRFVFPSDEFYCLSEAKLPEYDEYEGFPQYENGVGLMKSFEYEVQEGLELIGATQSNKKYVLATGTLANGFMNHISKMLTDKIQGLTIEVVPIINEFFGENITVSGLITGNDLVNQLMDYKDIDAVLIPKSMLKRDEDIFLDNLTVADIQDRLGIEIIPCEVDGKKFVNLLIEEVK